MLPLLLQLLLQTLYLVLQFQQCIWLLVTAPVLLIHIHIFILLVLLLHLHILRLLLLLLHFEVLSMPGHALCPELCHGMHSPVSCHTSDCGVIVVEPCI